MYKEDLKDPRIWKVFHVNYLCINITYVSNTYLHFSNLKINEMINRLKNIQKDKINMLIPDINVICKSIIWKI